MNKADVTHIELKNGMKLLCKPNKANPTVSIRLSLAGGIADDPRGKSGLANFARSLLAKGTKTHPAAWLSEKIDSLGLEIGFFAGRHTTSMSARVLSENLSPALKLIAEILSEPEPPSDEAERMRIRILTAIKQSKDDPAFVATDKMAKLIYGRTHPYAQTSNGTVKSVQEISLEDICGFYSEKLLPGAAICVIVGDISTAEIEDLADATLGRWTGGGSFDLEPPKSVKLAVEPKHIDVKMPGKTQSDVALGFQGISRLDPDFHALTVGNTVLGRLSLGGRIGQRVRDQEGLAYYAYTAFDAGIGAGPYVFRAGVNPAHVDRAVEVAVEEMRKARDQGITLQEMEDAVVYLAGGMARQVETNGGMASILLTQEIFSLGDDFYLRFDSILRDLSLDDVNKALAAHLHPDHYCLAVAGPEVDA